MLKVRYVVKLNGELFYGTEDIAEAYAMYNVLRNGFMADKLLWESESKYKGVTLEKEVWDDVTHRVEIVTLSSVF